MKYIIEHTENKIYDWCCIEYKHISKLVGRNNLIFTNINNKNDFVKLKNIGEVKKESILKLNFKNICLLDPSCEKELNPEDCEKFDYFLLGGILGDYAPRERTANYFKNLKAKRRNLTKEQMPTDVAVLAVKLISEGNKIENLKFKDKPVINIKKGRFNEEIILPYRYIMLYDKLIISKELIKYLKSKKDL